MVETRTTQAADASRDRTFTIETWLPDAATDAANNAPLVLFSHSSGGDRTQSSFLCTHLAAHGYVVTALDHSERFVPELLRPTDETPEQAAARQQAWIENRVPDVRFLLDHSLATLPIDPDRIAIAGHSFGGWTALATPDTEPRIQAVVALAPAGSRTPPPGMLKAPLALDWGRDIPTLLIAADGDTSLPIDTMLEIFDRIPSTKRMVTIENADHLHFMDDGESMHEMVRQAPWPEELAWLPKAMRPIGELSSVESVHEKVKRETLRHLDEVLRS